MLDNRHYNDFNHENTAFFTLFECVDDYDVVRSLFSEGFTWAQKRGLSQIIGPKGFTALDGLGLLVKGFEYYPALGVPYNPPYYTAFLSQIGFEPAGDIISGFFGKELRPPDKVFLVAQRVQEKRGLRVDCYRTR